MPDQNRAGNVFLPALLPTGRREHTVYGNEATMAALHEWLRDALEELGPQQRNTRRLRRAGGRSFPTDRQWKTVIDDPGPSAPDCADLR